jgi:hypothetical protein
VKVGDFGIARRAKEALLRLTGRAASGTLLYMSPEQLRGEREDRRTDVYSMGCVLYELLSGQPPFRTGSIEWQIQNQAPARLPNAPTPVWDAIARALAKERTERFGSCAEFAAALERKAVPEAAPVPPPPRPQPAAPPPAAPVAPPPAPAPGGSAATTAHYVFVNLARLALIAAMVFLGTAKNHVEVAGKDEYLAASIAGAGAAVLFFVVAAILAWNAQIGSGKPIGGTWHPAARFLLVLPALGLLVYGYVAHKGFPAYEEALHQSATMFGGLTFLLFVSFFAVRIWKTIVGVLLAAGIVAFPYLAGELRTKFEPPPTVTSRFSGNKVFTPEPPPRSEKNGGSAVFRLPDVPPQAPEYALAHRVASWGGGQRGNDLLDLWITGKEEAMRRVSSVSYQFPEGWQPSFQSSMDPRNSFATLLGAHTRFTVTATITHWDGTRRTVTQEVRWK